MLEGKAHLYSLSQVVLSSIYMYYKDRSTHAWKRDLQTLDGVLLSTHAPKANKYAYTEGKAKMITGRNTQQLLMSSG